MVRTRVTKRNGGPIRWREYDFTVVLTPVPAEPPPEGGGAKASGSAKKSPGYQVTVPLLPGIVTFGRDEKEALEMARDAIRCHIDGLRMSGEEIPDEKASHTAKVRIALSA
jgi:predicted RNase H-like HicB family nuclease